MIKSEKLIEDSFFFYNGFFPYMAGELSYYCLTSKVKQPLKGKKINFSPTGRFVLMYHCYGGKPGAKDLFPCL